MFGELLAALDLTQGMVKLFVEKLDTSIPVSLFCFLYFLCVQIYIFCQVHRSSVAVHLVREQVQYCLLVYHVLVQSTHQQTVLNLLVLTTPGMVMILECDVYEKVPKVNNIILI